MGVSYNTVKKYLQILESLYVVFRVTPYAKNIARALSKEPKIYFFDTGMVKNGEGARLENAIAQSLLKDRYLQEDLFGRELSLHYLRTTDKEEVDFVIANEGNATSLLEVKTRVLEIPKALRKSKDLPHIPAIMLVKELETEKELNDIHFRKAGPWLKELAL